MVKPINYGKRRKKEREVLARGTGFALYTRGFAG
jgi:hypothetical protein